MPQYTLTRIGAVEYYGDSYPTADTLTVNVGVLEAGVILIVFFTGYFYSVTEYFGDTLGYTYLPHELNARILPSDTPSDFAVSVRMGTPSIGSEGYNWSANLVVYKLEGADLFDSTSGTIATRVHSAGYDNDDGSVVSAEELWTARYKNNLTDKTIFVISEFFAEGAIQVDGGYSKTIDEMTLDYEFNGNGTISPSATVPYYTSDGYQHHSIWCKELAYNEECEEKLRWDYDTSDIYDQNNDAVGRMYHYHLTHTIYFWWSDGGPWDPSPEPGMIDVLYSEFDKHKYEVDDWDTHKISFRTYKGDGTLDRSVVIDTNTTCHQPRIFELGKHTLQVFYRRGTTGYKATSRDRGRTWTLTTLPFSGDILVYERAGALGSLSFPVALIYSKSGKTWSIAIYNNSADTWSSPATIATDAKFTIGRLVQKGSGNWEFTYQQDSTGNRVVKTCKNLSTSGGTATFT